jgi:hypothetical protein
MTGTDSRVWESGNVIILLAKLFRLSCMLFFLAIVIHVLT